MTDPPIAAVRSKLVLSAFVVDVPSTWYCQVAPLCQANVYRGIAGDPSLPLPAGVLRRQRLPLRCRQELPCRSTPRSNLTVTVLLASAVPLIV